ncbi:MAG: peptidase domain-containing ABC transporter [Lachnospiraceae bacterium]|jgi:ATP-binding cassette subfamily B protein|nr:peptidase domain-containing ABC transporter [Lachnospiraceae bacterium]
MRLKGIYQNDINDCGAACLATICTYYNYNDSLSGFIKLTECNSEGTNFYSLIRAANKIGFYAEALQGGLADFLEEIAHDRRNFPLIAQVSSESICLHFIVVTKVGSRYIHFFDPAIGYRRVTKSDFENIWTGNILLITKSESFTEKKIISHSGDSYYRILFGYKVCIVLIMTFSLMLTGLNFLGTLSFRKLFDALVSSKPHLYTDELIKFSNGIHFHRLIVIIGIIYLLGFAFFIFRSYLIAHVSKQFHRRLLVSFFEKLLRLPLSYFKSKNDGELLNRLLLTREVVETMINSLLVLVLSIMQSIVSAIILFKISNELFFCISALGVFQLIIVFLTKKQFRKNIRETTKKEASLLSYYKESITAIETIKSTNCQKFRNTCFEKAVNQFTYHACKGEQLAAIKVGLEELINNVGSLIVIAIGGLFVFTERITLGTLLIFQPLISYFLEPIKNIIELQYSFQKFSVSSRKISEVFEATTEDEYSCPVTELPFETKEICFNKVTFSYSDAHPLLREAEFRIGSGEKLLLMGDNGAGKTTLSKLLIRFYRVEDGNISIGGININDIPVEILRNNIAYASQNHLLFSGTLYENLTLGRRKISIGEIIHVLEICQLGEFVAHQENGLMTILSENAMGLSSGERQKLCLARTLLQKPEILILDEATCHLDVESEMQILSAIFSEYKKMTCIIVNHRKNALFENLPKYRIENGKILKARNISC